MPKPKNEQASLLFQTSRNGARLISVLIAVYSTSVHAATKTDPIHVVSAQEINLYLEKFTIIDARESGFRDGHPAGAQAMDWKDWTLEKPNFLHWLIGHPENWGKVPLPNETLRDRLRALGLSEKAPILVVGSPRGWGEEGRIAWNLLYWGAQDVSLLDGGYPAWVAAKLPIEKGLARPPQKIGTFTLHLDSDRIAKLNDVKNNLTTRDRPLLDARSPEEFLGKRMEAQKRGGHLPGAKLISVSELYQPNGYYVNAAKLSALYGARASKSAITYCVGGVRSALLALLIEARLGIKVANYDASIWEWSNETNLPLISGQ